MAKVYQDGNQLVIEFPNEPKVFGNAALFEFEFSDNAQAVRFLYRGEKQIAPRNILFTDFTNDLDAPLTTEQEIFNYLKGIVGWL